MIDTHLLWIALPILGLAWVNGANDVSKGVSTLIGSGMTQPAHAIWWGTFWTLLGGLAAVAWGAKLVSAFGGGFLAPDFAQSQAFVVGALCGAFAWVLLATVFGLPVSTTHALLGGTLGSALMLAGPAGLRLGVLADKAFLPLAISPLMAIGVCWLLLWTARWVGRWIPEWRPGCCDQSDWQANPFICETPASAKQKLAARLWTGLHWLSGAAISFARGLNDVPKIAAFLIVAAAAGGAASGTNHLTLAILLVSLSMAIGGLWGGLRVAKVLAHRVTRMDNAQGLTANLGTSLLVLAATPLGLPVSTTHVSTGSLFGLRWAQRSPPTQRDALLWILFAWVVTLPVAALIAAAVTTLVGLI